MKTGTSPNPSYSPCTDSGASGSISEPRNSNYPLLHSAFWTEHRLWGESVLCYHLVNIVLHAVSAGLVVLVRHLRLAGAWLAGFIFALHPVSVEAVAWISEQKTTLSTAFYLASALAYLRFDQTRRRSLYFLASGLFLAGNSK
jgi:hypothetical protein